MHARVSMNQQCGFYAIKTNCTLGYVWKDSGRHAEKKCYDPLLSTGESTPPILCPVLSSPSPREILRNWKGFTGDLTQWPKAWSTCPTGRD